jgi:hypothetical protein
MPHLDVDILSSFLFPYYHYITPPTNLLLIFLFFCNKQIFESLLSGKLSARNFSQSILHPKPSSPTVIDWIFLVDTLNFSFWTGVTDADKDSPKWIVHFKGQNYTGYFALCAAVNRAIEVCSIESTAFFYDDVICSTYRDMMRLRQRS